MKCRTSSEIRSGNDGGHAFPAPSTSNALVASTPANLRNQQVYAYIITTINPTRDYQLVQTGSGPNFAGGRITLCTCKHQDRATFHPSDDSHDPWKNVWVAGLTTKTKEPQRALAYLMCVERSFESQVELWRHLPSGCRLAKSASKSQLGDLFEPKSTATNYPFNPEHYYSPIAGHVHSKPKYPNAWHEDVMLWWKRNIPHRLLLGQIEQSHRWIDVKMILKPNAIGSTAHHSMFSSLFEFCATLEEFDL